MQKLFQLIHQGSKYEEEINVQFSNYKSFFLNGRMVGGGGREGEVIRGNFLGSPLKYWQKGEIKEL